MSQSSDHGFDIVKQPFGNLSGLMSIRFLSRTRIEMGDSVTLGFCCGFAFATGFPVTPCSTFSREVVYDVWVREDSKWKECQRREENERMLPGESQRTVFKRGFLLFPPRKQSAWKDSTIVLSCFEIADTKYRKKTFERNISKEKQSL